MEILGNLSKADDNGVLICEYVDQESYREVIMLLTLPDLMLLMASLEVLYLLAQLGEIPCSKIASVDHSIEMYSEYLATCSKMGRSNILNSTGFLKCLRTVFPNHTMRRQEEAKASNQLQILLVGIRRRAIPLPIQLYYQQPQQQHQNPAAAPPPPAARHEAPGDPQAPPPGPPNLGPQFVRAPGVSNSAAALASTAQETSRVNHPTVPCHPVPPQVSPQLPPSPLAAQQQQVRTAPATQNHSPQNSAPPPVPQQQLHSPMLPTGTPVTLFQPVPQGHILTARVQGVCSPITQQPPLPQTLPVSGPQGGAPQVDTQCTAAVSVPPSIQVGGSQAQGIMGVASSQGSRVTFQNIAPKPAPNQSGFPTATMAPPNQQPQPQQPAQSVVIVGPNPQQNAAYPPAIHQIVLANPPTIPGAQTVQIAGQPGAASSPCSPAASHSNTQVQSNQAVCHALSTKRQHQQQPPPLQIVSQTPPTQPTSNESSLIKQLLLPKRGPSTPGGKLILPAPQVPPPNNTIAPNPQVIYQNPSPQPVSVQLVPGQLPAAGAPPLQTVQLLPGHLISTSTPGGTAIIQGPTAAGQVTFTVVPNTGFTTSTAAVAAVSQGVVAPGVPQPPFSTGTAPHHISAGAPLPPPLPAPLRGDRIICQKEEEAKDATGLHIHERKIEVMENSSLAEGDSSKGKTSNGDVAAGAKLLNGGKCMEPKLPPYHSGNSQGVLNGPATDSLSSNGKQALSPSPNNPLEGNPDPKKTLVNGVCDFERGDSGGNFNKNIPNHIASKPYLGNGEVGASEKTSDQSVPSPPPSQQDTAKAQQAERLANGPQAAGLRPSSELTNGPLGPGHGTPVLRQQLLPNSSLPSTVPAQSPAASPANGVASEPRGLKRPAENEDRSPAATSSGIPSKVGVRIITISDPNNAGSSATMVAVPAGTDPSTVAKVAIENATQQRNCSPSQAAGMTPTVTPPPAPSSQSAPAGNHSPHLAAQQTPTAPSEPGRKAGQNFKCLWQSCKRYKAQFCFTCLLMCSTPAQRAPKAIVNHPSAALMALRRGSRNLVFRDFTVSRARPLFSPVFFALRA
ncbi:hypothetical protein GOODEAATRI_012889, partial [Goodea atripinnis]